MRRLGLGSVVTASLLVYGCVAHPVVVEVEPPRPAAPPPPRSDIVSRPGKPGMVVAAPPGSSDTGTADIAEAVARRTGFGLVVATGVAFTPEARAVYEAYERRVRDTARGSLAFYVEIQGNDRRDTADRIEIATVGIDSLQAAQLRTLLELTRDAHLRGHPGAPRLAIAVEPADRMLYAASGAKRGGVLGVPARALHVELPRIARTAFGAVYAAILGDFLAEAATLRPLR